MNRVARSLRRVVAAQARGAPDAELLARFAADRDEAAFAALVLRHAGMVHRVCRSALRHEQEAEDACQATFLVLAERADRVRRPESLAAWLHGVALRVCRKARAAAARRAALPPPQAPPAADPAAAPGVREVARVLHEELGRLPERYRGPLVLCYLEDRSHEEAAAALGWTLSSFRGRLDRARRALRRRVERRGLTLAAALLAAGLGPEGGPLYAAGLAGPAARSAALGLERGAEAGVVSPGVFRLTREVLKTMTVSPFKLAAAGLAAMALAAGVGLGPAALSGQPAGSGGPAGGSPPAAAPAPRDTLAAALGQRGYVAVPLVRSKSGTLDLEVLANGRRLLLVVDTAAAHTTLDAAHADLGKRDMLLEKPGGDEKNEALLGAGTGPAGTEKEGLLIGGIAGGRAPGEGKQFGVTFDPEKMVVDKFAAGGVSARLEVRFRKESPANAKRAEAGDPPADGVLGGDFLGAHAAVIDYASVRLYLLDPARK